MVGSICARMRFLLALSGFKWDSREAIFCRAFFISSGSSACFSAGNEAVHSSAFLRRYSTVIVPLRLSNNLNAIS